MNKDNIIMNKTIQLMKKTNFKEFHFSWIGTTQIRNEVRIGE